VGIKIDGRRQLGGREEPPQIGETDQGRPQNGTTTPNSQEKRFL